jgi:hypothetical protein
VADELSLDVAIAPERAVQMVASAINLPKKRAFGVLKTQNEYVGFVREESFEVWERQGRAIHAIGEITPQRGGSRIVVRTVVPTRTRVLMVAFFVLYALASVGIAERGSDQAVTIEEIAVAVGGGLILAAIFVAAARKQRADLRALIVRIFADAPRI